MRLEYLLLFVFLHLYYCIVIPSLAENNQQNNSTKKSIKDGNITRKNLKETSKAYEKELLQDGDDKASNLSERSFIWIKTRFSAPLRHKHEYEYKPLAGYDFNDDDNINENVLGENNINEQQMDANSYFPSNSNIESVLCNIPHYRALEERYRSKCRNIIPKNDFHNQGSLENETEKIVISDKSKDQDIVFGYDKKPHYSTSLVRYKTKDLRNPYHLRRSAHNKLEPAPQQPQQPQNMQYPTRPNQMQVATNLIPNIRRPPYLSQNVPQSLPLRPQNIAQSLAQSLTQSLPQSIPQSVSQNVPQSLSQSIPQKISQSIPDNIKSSLATQNPVQSHERQQYMQFQQNVPNYQKIDQEQAIEQQQQEQQQQQRQMQQQQPLTRSRQPAPKTHQLKNNNVFVSRFPNQNTIEQNELTDADKLLEYIKDTLAGNAVKDREGKTKCTTNECKKKNAMKKSDYNRKGNKLRKGSENKRRGRERKHKKNHRSKQINVGNNEKRLNRSNIVEYDELQQDVGKTYLHDVVRNNNNVINTVN